VRRAPEGMRLIIDINVPDRVSEVYLARGHDVVFARDRLGPTVPDPDLAALADEIDGIVITWDKDFSRLIARAALGNRQPYRRAGRISYTGCSYHHAVARTERLMPLIEFEYAHLQQERDKRLILTIHQSIVIIER
jgi:hypothetical protein